jgi:hypothetical protein
MSARGQPTLQASSMLPDMLQTCCNVVRLWGLACCQVLVPWDPAAQRQPCRLHSGAVDAQVGGKGEQQACASWFALRNWLQEPGVQVSWWWHLYTQLLPSRGCMHNMALLLHCSRLYAPSVDTNVHESCAVHGVLCRPPTSSGAWPCWVSWVRRCGGPCMHA